MTGAHPAGGAEAPVVPGEVLVADDPIVLFAGRPTLTVEVVNTGDRPIQVGSHYHLAEANPALAFDRAAARGWRLAIPAGTAVRFEPGIERTVTLVPLAGRRVVAGLRGEVAGALDRPSGGERDGDRPSGGERDGDRPSGGERDGDRLSGGERPDGADR